MKKRKTKAEGSPPLFEDSILYITEFKKQNLKRRTKKMKQEHFKARNYHRNIGQEIVAYRANPESKEPGKGSKGQRMRRR